MKFNNLTGWQKKFEIDDDQKRDKRHSDEEDGLVEGGCDKQGTGLGFWIVQFLVRLIGGEIRITDKAMREKRTCFPFNVLSTSKPPENETWIKSVCNGLKPTQDEQRSDDEILRGKRVLVVGDIFVLVERMLKRMGVSEVKQCDSGEEAVRLVTEWLTQRNQQAFDYVWMNCQMPEMDGFEATREIREVEEKYGVHTPILAVFSHIAKNSIEVRKFLLYRMDALIEKNIMAPCHFANIIREIERKRTREEIAFY